VIRTLFYIGLTCLASCTLPEEKELKKEERARQQETTVIQTIDTNLARKMPEAPSLPTIAKIREPKGVYHVVLDVNGKMEQTVAFNSDYSYRMQERYLDKGDSVVITEGNWNPSNGYIWLYKDQVVRGRYKWQGETLQYFNPESKKSYPMHALTDVMSNAVWVEKGKMGFQFYGIGNEPFWSVELNKRDSLKFFLADKEHPVEMKIQTVKRSGDSTTYFATNDSAILRMTLLPFFCSDGMSDFVYRNQVLIHYKREIYRGCGMVYKKP
jgi:uncharacterized membrane protein